MHFRDPENTFEYYNPPIYTSFGPHTGPNIGGTPVTINGFGFTPLKDGHGRPDKKRNKMYVRFVDPDTGEELAPAS